MRSQPVDSLLEIMATLRAPSIGCPWDIEQSFETIAPYTVEEAYEVAEAIRSGDLDALRDELGDLLFQVVFHARMAEERGAFAFGDVVNAVSAKMVARHPHVFGGAAVADADAQTVNWEAQKERERQRKANRAGAPRSSVLDDVPLALPALMRAEKLQRRAARTGFDWPNAAPVFDKVREELDEIAAPDADIPAELGDLLFSAVNLARKLGVQPETVLRDANARFERRFRKVEALAHDEGTALPEAPLAELDRLWDLAKREEKDAG
ncbi:MAG: nucleoside triphosphate pyrophosphohydrolase [Alphaproteobacteria bacterium]|nr:nucleoside triphosphate pyrophosphohydrolase [Alphaproteobacteria bacterium]